MWSSGSSSKSKLICMLRFGWIAWEAQRVLRTKTWVGLVWFCFRLLLTNKKAFPSGVWTEKWKVLRELDSPSSLDATVLSRKQNLSKTNQNVWLRPYSFFLCVCCKWLFFSKVIMTTKHLNNERPEYFLKEWLLLTTFEVRVSSYW